ncbi:hypothetical protein MmiEs2_13660 [Methanimicrococcus stummii]|uniref:Ferric oxidoreductase domain-containing protein n=1 Tax=Methanimicrococcus stummii TaxID=3028294 RepID=A0AA96ZXM7_9EURY|nr:hypothetical protein [Methanimicrococcus sp. Es2]WNY29149.1 hypothetical protein MmiEs2_13660 [Methanimicrococcus sp. Es2]
MNAYLWFGIPTVVKGILISLVFALIFRKQIKKYPLVFYIYPAAMFVWYGLFGLIRVLFDIRVTQVLGLSGTWVSDIMGLFRTLDLFAPFGIGLITIVMFIGVLPKTKTVIHLYQIRSELSIIGATLLVAHGFMRLSNAMEYLDGSYEGSFNLTVLAFGIIGPIILILILLPWLTSFKFIRKQMKPKTWKKLQTYFSVPMFIGMLLFGWAFTARAVGDYDLTALGDIILNSRGNAVSIKTGADFATSVLASKVYLMLLISYIWLRVKKIKEQKKKSGRQTAHE